jgi:hypothetical protein
MFIFKEKHQEFIDDKRHVNSIIVGRETGKFTDMIRILTSPQTLLIPYMEQSQDPSDIVDLILPHRYYRMIIPVLQCSMHLTPHPLFLVGDRVWVRMQSAGKSPEYEPILTYQLKDERVTVCIGFPALFCALNVPQHVAQNTTKFKTATNTWAHAASYFPQVMYGEEEKTMRFRQFLTAWIQRSKIMFF